MFQSRISSTARAAGKACVVERSAIKLVERVQEPDSVSLVLIDLTLQSVDLTQDIPLLHQSFSKCKILAYGPHVDVERLTLAQEAGADEVVTRGQMDRELVAIIRGA
jgi:DNA-binding NarL/FixJ family response regulator